MNTATIPACIRRVPYTDDDLDVLAVLDDAEQPCPEPLSRPATSPTPASAAPQPDEDDVLAILTRKRAEREATRRLQQEERPAVALPALMTLQQRFNRPPKPTRYRIDGWQPAGARVMMSAQFKAGKTTGRDNVVRSLADGDPWLGNAEVTPVSGRVTVIDNEMSESQAENWLQKQGIKNLDRVALCCLRGS